MLIKYPRRFDSLQRSFWQRGVGGVYRITEANEALRELLFRIKTDKQSGSRDGKLDCRDFLLKKKFEFSQAVNGKVLIWESDKSRKS